MASLRIINGDSTVCVRNPCMPVSAIYGGFSTGWWLADLRSWHWRTAAGRDVGLLIAPKAKRRLAEPWRFLVELVLFGLAAAALRGWHGCLWQSPFWLSICSTGCWSSSGANKSFTVVHRSSLAAHRSRHTSPRYRIISSRQAHAFCQRRRESKPSYCGRHPGKPSRPY